MDTRELSRNGGWQPLPGAGAFILKHNVLAQLIGSCFFILATVICAWGSATPHWTRSVPINEEVPGPKDLQHYPADGQTVTVNPPGFTWTSNRIAGQYRLELRQPRTSRTLLSTQALNSTVYPPFKALKPGEYDWQVIYLDLAGKPLARSKTRRFRINAGTPELTMPDMSALKVRLATIRPRLFLSGEHLRELREAVVRGAVGAWSRLKNSADEALLEPLYPEPSPYQPGIPPDQEWLRTFTPGKIGSSHAARTALAYQITGEQKYLEGARRWLMTLASWNPKGITSHNLPLPDGGNGNDEASMPMLERMSLAWDWMGDQLSTDERLQVLLSIKERGNQVLRTLQNQDFLSHPFDNHSGRVIAFLGEAGLAFLGDIPQADQWLDYVLRCYLTSYPAWGGDEGGWSQGMSYWSFYVYSHTNFLEALRDAAGTDVFRRPFYRNTGYLPVYFHPPYAPQGGFGDGSYHPPSEVEVVLTNCLAEVNRDPILKWQAVSAASLGEKNTTRWREWFMEDVIETVRQGRPSTLSTLPPDKLDPARHMADIGWVAMHSALGDAENDVWVLFKSSRFGSFSHSHADQNTFQMYAYGRALAIDSGYYPSYGTPHDDLWTRQTHAHNGILVNGRGQPAHTWEASGRIESFERHGTVTVVRGQAAEAYNVSQMPSLAQIWEKYLKVPLPAMEPKVETFERTLAFVGSKTRPILAVLDYLRTDAPTTFSWLLHALNPMKIGESDGLISIEDGNARLAVKLLAEVPYSVEQNTGFPVQPEIAANTAYVLGKESFADQSHLTATTRRQAQEMKFLAVFVPYRAPEAPPDIVPLSDERTSGFRIGDTEVSAWWGAGRHGVISCEMHTSNGSLVVKTSENGESKFIVVK